MQFRDLKRQYEHVKPEMDAALLRAVADGQYIMGKDVSDLERQLADYVGVRHCVACANGTDALQLCLMAWGVGEGDAVFTSDFTFFASAGSASILGATPVFVDIEEDTFNLSPADLEKQIERVLAEKKLRPRVIVPVDLFGLPANYPEIERIAKKYGLLILEDAAQGFGGSVAGKRACAFGDAATTSFFPAKPLGCYGDGGAIFTNDEALAVKLQSLRAQGRSEEDKYDNRLIGMNSRLDTVQAAVLKVKLAAFAKSELDSVNRVAAQYTRLLGDAVKTPRIPAGYGSSWAQYTILLPDEQARDGLKAHLAQAGIPSMVYYPRGLHQQTAYLPLGYTDRDYPVTSDVKKRCLSLPMHPYMTEDEVELVVKQVIAFVEKENVQ